MTREELALFPDTLPVCQFFNLNYDMATPFKVYGSMQDHGSFRGKVDLAAGRTGSPPRNSRTPPRRGLQPLRRPDQPDVVYSAGFYGTISRAEYDKPGPSRAIRSRRRSCPSFMRTSRPCAANGWPRSSSRPTIRTSSTTACSTSSGPSTAATPGSGSVPIDHERSGTRGDIRYQTALRDLGVAHKIRLIYADGRRAAVGHQGRRQGLDRDHGRPGSGQVDVAVVASAYGLGTVYLTQNGKRDDDFTPYVWKSTDYGKTWTSLSKGIPVGPVNVIREDPVNANILYVGTDMGVYVTTDGGKTWMVLGGTSRPCMPTI